MDDGRYEQRLNDVLDHIEANFDQGLSLETLAGIASFSPFHFHGELGGGQMPKEALAKMVLVLKDGTYDYCEGNGHDFGNITEVGKKTPLGMDVVGTKGPNKGHTIKAIYKFDGKSLTMCYAAAGPRPTSFSSKGKGVTLLITYRKA